MAKFLFIYRESTVSRAQPSPEEMQALAAAWGTWMQKFSSAIVPGGDGLKHTGRLVKAGLVTDGPYVESKEIIVSFAVIQADDYDAGCHAHGFAWAWGQQAKPRAGNPPTLLCRRSL